MNREEAKARYGLRVQRCNGCYAGFYLKDMWLAEGGELYCEGCRDDNMFHFEEFTEGIDFAKLPGLQEESEETTQCQNPFSRQA